MPEMDGYEVLERVKSLEVETVTHPDFSVYRRRPKDIFSSAWHTQIMGDVGNDGTAIFPHAKPQSLNVQSKAIMTEIIFVQQFVAQIAISH